MIELKSLFSTRHSTVKKPFDLAAFTTSLESMQGAQSSVLMAATQIGTVSFESFGDIDHDKQAAYQDLYSTLAEQLQSEGFESFNQSRGDDAARVEDNQVLAATVASIGVSNEGHYKNALKRSSVAVQSNDPNVVNVNPMMDGPHGSVPVLADGLENYNEKSQRDFRVISVAYNLAAARQDAFGEAIYPTVVVNPTEGGVTQNVTYAAVMQDVFHETTGALFDTREVNMVEAFRDPTVLEDTSTRLIPVVTDDNKDKFVADTKVAPKELKLDKGGLVSTAPLVPGKKLDLIGLSNRNQLIASNLLDLSDTIDPALKLKTIYVENKEGKVMSFVVERMPTAVFQPSLQDDTRLAQLNFLTEDLVVSPSKTAVDGSVGTALSELASRGWTLRLGLAVNGYVSLSKGETSITATAVAVEHILDESGESLSTTKGSGKDIVDAFGDMKVIGYELDARFTNTNRRERGQLIQTRTKQFRYPIPMHSPITLPMSTMDENGPGDVVKTLTVATNTRNSIAAVTRLLNYLAQLREVVSAGNNRPKFGAVEGALSVMMRPTYRHVSLDLRDAIDTIRSKDRWEDCCSVILNTIKSELFPAVRESNIEAAFQTITGNADEKPKFIIATDKEIANYLMVKGDDRTLGAQYKYDIVSTNNRRFDGKIVVIPTRENPVENDILNFGQFYYVPTIVADLPISRNGQISREIAAVPFNLHVNNIPFAIEIDVAGLRDVMGQSMYNSLPGFQYERTDGGDAGDSGDTGTP